MQPERPHHGNRSDSTVGIEHEHVFPQRQDNLLKTGAPLRLRCPIVPRSKSGSATNA